MDYERCGLVGGGYGSYAAATVGIAINIRKGRCHSRSHGRQKKNNRVIRVHDADSAKAA